MRFIAPPTMRVIKKEEKEAQLKDLVSTYIGQQAHGDASQAVLRLVVRSHESPVVRALAALARDLAAARISIDVVVSLPGAADLVTWPTELAAITRCRTVHDIRLLDAHEQLWLDAETIWIGDCMRREPAKRDAYECYGRGCRTTAAQVLAAFEMFWNKGEPAAHSGITSVEKPARPDFDPASMVAVPGAEQSPPPTAMTRH